MFLIYIVRTCWLLDIVNHSDGEVCSCTVKHTVIIKMSLQSFFSWVWTSCDLAAFVIPTISEAATKTGRVVLQWCSRASHIINMTGSVVWQWVVQFAMLCLCHIAEKRDWQPPCEVEHNLSRSCTTGALIESKWAAFGCSDGFDVSAPLVLCDWSVFSCLAAVICESLVNHLNANTAPNRLFLRRCLFSFPPLLLSVLAL